MVGATSSVKVTVVADDTAFTARADWPATSAEVPAKPANATPRARRLRLFIPQIIRHPSARGSLTAVLIGFKFPGFPLKSLVYSKKSKARRMMAGRTRDSSTASPSKFREESAAGASVQSTLEIALRSGSTSQHSLTPYWRYQPSFSVLSRRAVPRDRTSTTRSGAPQIRSRTIEALAVETKIRSG